MRKKHSNKLHEPPLVLFDGVCNLCNASVRFLLAHNRKENLHFASLQSEFAKAILQPFGIATNPISTIIFLEDGLKYTNSSAVFQITKHLNQPWKSIYHFRFIPKVISDSVYRFIANYRYRWFGKRDQCLVPNQDYKSRFYG